MDRELQTYYEEQFSMMSTQGWQDLMEDFQKLREQTNDLSSVADAQSLHFRQGQLDILGLLLNRKVMCEKAWEDLQDASNL